MARVQMKLNLHIVELQLKAQPSTPLEIREQRTTAVITTMAVIDSAVADCRQLFEQSFDLLTTLQEDSNVDFLEIEARELQERYDEIKGTA